MSAMGRIAMLTLVLTYVARSGWAEDVKSPPSPEQMAKILAEVGTPGLEHAKLQPLAGSWSYTCKIWMDPSQPPMETHGTIERRWVLGGRFLEEKTTGTGFDGKPGFEGLGLLGYDKAQKTYTSTWACSMGTGTCSGRGTADASGTKFTFQTEVFCPVLKKIIQGHDEIRIESANRVVTESYHVLDGKEVKGMELVAIRRK